MADREIWMTIDFENGDAVPDGQLDRWWADIVSNRVADDSFTIGTESMFLRVRLGVGEGDMTNVNIVCGDMIEKIPPNGVMSTAFWTAYPDVYSSMLTKIVNVRYAER